MNINNIVTYAVVICITVFMTNVINWKALRENSEIGYVAALDLDLNETIAYLQALNETYERIETMMTFSNRYISDRATTMLTDILEILAATIYIDPQTAYKKLYHLSLYTDARYREISFVDLAEINPSLLRFFRQDGQIITMGSIVINLYKIWFTGISYGLGGAYFFLSDPVTAQLISYNVALSFVMWLFRESFYQIVKRFFFTSVKFWEFNKVMDAVGNFGFIDTLLSGVNTMIVVRSIMMIMGFPFILSIGAGTLFFIVVFFTIYVFFKRMHRDLHYKVELKIDATIILKNHGKGEAKSATMLDRFSLGIIGMFWNVVPLSVRVARHGFEWRPYRNLMAPNIFMYYFTPIVTTLLLPLIYIIDTLYYTAGWLFIYFWIYPYISNKRIADDKWNIIVDAAGLNSVIINGTEVLESEKYLTSYYRSVALYMGWHEPYEEIIYRRGEFDKSLSDWKNAYPDSGKIALCKAYELPYRYLKGKVLPLNPSLKEMFDLYIVGLEADGTRLGDKTEPAISGYAKKLVKNSVERALYKEQLLSYTRAAYGIAYVNLQSLPAMILRLDEDKPFLVGQLTFEPAEAITFGPQVGRDFCKDFHIPPDLATLMEKEVDMIFNTTLIQPISESKPENLMFKILYIRMCARRLGFDIKYLPEINLGVEIPKLKTSRTALEQQTIVTSCMYMSMDTTVGFFMDLRDALRYGNCTDYSTYDRYTEESEWMRALFLEDAYERLKQTDGDRYDDRSDSDAISGSEEDGDLFHTDDESKSFDFEKAEEKAQDKIEKERPPSSMIADDSLTEEVPKEKKPISILKKKPPRLEEILEEMETKELQIYGGEKKVHFDSPKPPSDVKIIIGNQIKTQFPGLENELKKVLIPKRFNFSMRWKEGYDRTKVLIDLRYHDYRFDDHDQWAEHVSEFMGLPANLSYTTVYHYVKTYLKVDSTFELPFDENDVKKKLGEILMLPEKINVSYYSIIGNDKMSLDSISVLMDRLRKDRLTLQAISPILSAPKENLGERFAYLLKVNFMFFQRYLARQVLEQMVKMMGARDYKHIDSNIGDRAVYSSIPNAHKQDVQLAQYVNNQTLTIRPANPIQGVGLKIVGKQREYHSSLGYMYNNMEMRNRVLSLRPDAPVDVYEAVKPDRKLVLEAVKKYESRPCAMRLDETYEGVKFIDWVIKQLDYFFNTHEGTSVNVRSIESFSVDDLTAQSKKAFPGFKSRAAGIQVKGLNVETSKKMAEAYRREVLEGEDADHIWCLIPVPKTSKIGEAEVRVVLAPEMYFYINQYLLFEEFKNIVSHSKVSSDFSIFFGNFDAACRRFPSEHMKEELDLRSMGGRIPQVIAEVFLKWYKRFVNRTADRELLQHIVNDIFKSMFMLPVEVGGEVLEKTAGWGDGPFGTGNFDTFAMMVYYLYNVWKNIISEGVGLELVQFQEDNVVFDSHGDNWLHAYPLLKKAIYGWKAKHLMDLGQEVKGTIKNSLSLEDLELMGFRISYREGYFVGYRPFAKTIKSLTINKRKPTTTLAQREYEAGIIHSLLLVDCWNEDSFSLLQRLWAEYNGVQPRTNDIEVQNRITLLAQMNFSPREAWKTGKQTLYDEDKDPTFIDSQ